MISRRSLIAGLGGGAYLSERSLAQGYACPGSLSNGKKYTLPGGPAGVREAVHVLAKDAKRWEAFAAAHHKVRRKIGVALAEWHRACCAANSVGVHEPKWFLAWHRLAVHVYEQALRSVNPAVSVPYWDWEAFAAVPDSYDQDPRLQPFCPDGTTASPRDWRGGVWCKTSLDTGALIEKTDFVTFSGRTVASNAHWLVHNWTSKQMRTASTAAFDPLFFVHHANIDRVWHRWKKAFPDVQLNAATAGLEIPFQDPDGVVRNVTIGQLWSETALGYSYEPPAKSLSPTWTSPSWKPEVRYLRVEGLPVPSGDSHDHHQIREFRLVLITADREVAFSLALGPHATALPVQMLRPPDDLDLSRGFSLEVRRGDSKPKAVEKSAVKVAVVVRPGGR